MKSLRVNEIFGPTFQGEGPSTGRLASFVRLTGCNLDCRWCDTPYTWDWDGKLGRAFDQHAETHVMPTWMIGADVRRMGARLVVITGGEPLLQYSSLLALVDELEDRAIEIETNGTRPPAMLAARENVRFNVSPKLTSSGVDRDRAWDVFRLQQYAELPRTAFKFVVQCAQDLADVEQLRALVGNLDPSRVWLMPEGVTRAAQLDAAAVLAEYALGKGYNLSVRLHSLLWENTRAR